MPNQVVAGVGATTGNVREVYVIVRRGVGDYALRIDTITNGFSSGSVINCKSIEGAIKACPNQQARVALVGEINSRMKKKGKRVKA